MIDRKGVLAQLFLILFLSRGYLHLFNLLQILFSLFFLCLAQFQKTTALLAPSTSSLSFHLCLFFCLDAYKDFSRINLHICLVLLSTPTFTSRPLSSFCLHVCLFLELDLKTFISYLWAVRRLICQESNVYKKNNISNPLPIQYI